MNRPLAHRADGMLDTGLRARGISSSMIMRILCSRWSRTGAVARSLVRWLTYAAVNLAFGCMILATHGAAAGSSGRHADLPGAKLWFTDSGGNGVPIVLLHANTGTSESWDVQAAAFAAQGYRVIAFDRRGWGKSVADPATGPQPGSVAGDLDALADHLKLDRFHLVGVAGGGFVAIDYAAWRPERLRSLVVAASTGQFSEPEMRDITARIEIPELRRQGAVYREVGPSYRGADPDGTQRWIAIEEHARQPGAPAQPLRTPNTFAKLEAITVPILVMAADADLLAPPALMRKWAAHLKGYEWAAVADSGHAVAWERPEAFNETVLAFLKQH
jgi:pimeloyl-ACP methyl ester carboxylesterase